MGEAAMKDENPDSIEAAVDAVIRMASGDMRAAIRGLIRGAASYEDEIDRTVSAGYVCRRPTTEKAS